VTHWQVNRAFPRQTLIAIEQAIKASETAHVGEIRFAVEGALDGTPLFKGQSAKERAIEVFSLLRVWKNGNCEKIGAEQEVSYGCRKK